MDTILFITQSLSQVQLRLLATCDGLTQEQVLWRPGPQANNIGFILWHVARVEDTLASRAGGNQPTLWESEGFHERFGQPVDAPDPGDRPGLRALQVPALEVLTDYLDAAYRRTQELLSTLKPEGLGIVPDPSRPERTLAASLRYQ